jgi:hypothetical protein
MGDGRKYPPAENGVLTAYLVHLKKSGAGEYAITRKPDGEERNARIYDFECTRKDGQCIAVEVSSAWRRDDAGREDHEWSKWCAKVNGVLSRELKGTYHCMTSMSVPRGLTPEAAADAIKKALPEVDRKPRGRTIRIELEKFVLALSWFEKKGAIIEFSRFAPTDVIPEFRSFLIEIVKSKDEQLAKAKARGLPTHLVAYNTCWPLFNDTRLQLVVKEIPPSVCRNVDSLVIVHGNVPDDCWCIPQILPR